MKTKQLFKTLRKTLFVGALLLSSSALFAQVKVGDNPTTINAGSVLELESSDKGLLMPRISLTNTTTWGLAGTATAGMHVYNSNTGITSTNINYPTLSAKIGEYYWDGNGWVALIGFPDSPVHLSAYFTNFFTSSGYVKLNFSGKRYDKNNSLDLTNDQIVVPVTGYYQASGYITSNTQSYVSGLYITAFINGANANIVMAANAAPNVGIVATGSALIKLTAGDILDFRVSSSAAVSGPGGEMTVSFVSR